MTEFAQTAVWIRPARLFSRLLPPLGSAAAAILVWTAFEAARPDLPIWIRLVAGLTLIFGPGAAAVSAVAAGLSGYLRIALAFGFGLGLAPTLAHLLAGAGWLDAYPYIAFGLAGASLAYWLTVRPPAPADLTRLARFAPAVVVLFALVVGGVAYSHRLTENGSAVTVNGEYDAYDLTYYAAIAAEASHTVPPMSPFYAGRLLNHSFYPHLALALANRFADVPIVDLYFLYAWPLFLALAALLCFLLTQEIASARAGLLAAALLVLGSDLSFLVAWFAPPRGWDDVVWSANFLSPGAETLLFNNWTPALALVFAGLIAVARAERGATWRWTTLAAASFAIAILFKPFAFALVMAGLGGAMLGTFRSGDLATRVRLFVTGSLTLVMSVPILARIILLFDDAQVTFQAAAFPLPLRMLGRLRIDRTLMPTAAAITADPFWQLVILGIIGTPLFLIGGLGFRLYGMPAVWRALVHPSRERPIVRVLAWSVVGALIVPFFVTSVPYHETMQIHQFGLFLLAIFVACTLAPRMSTWQGRVTALAIFALAVPSTWHFIERKVTDAARPFATAGPSERAVAGALRRADPDTTLVLHSDPSDASLINILSGRRSVLAWSRYVRDSDVRRREVDRFFQARLDATEALAILDRYRPTHVIEDRTRDRLHPALQSRLRMIFQTPQMALYAVTPEQ